MKSSAAGLAPLLLPALPAGAGPLMPESHNWDFSYQNYHEDGDRILVESYYLRGGAVHLDSSTGVFERCLFGENRAGNGGAIYAENDSHIQLVESRITDNEAISSESPAGS